MSSPHTEDTTTSTDSSSTISTTLSTAAGAPAADFSDEPTAQASSQPKRSPSTTSMTSMTTSIKSSPWAWLALICAAVGLIVVGGLRDSGPRTPDERIESIEKRIACPVCSGESVYESRTSASEQIRQLIRQEVRAGTATDDEILADVSSRYQNADILVPSGRGIDALAWILPAMALVFGAIGLGLAFRRWRLAAAETATATAADYAIVEAALDAQDHDLEAQIGDLDQSEGRDRASDREPSSAPDDPVIADSQDGSGGEASMAGDDESDAE